MKIYMATQNVNGMIHSPLSPVMFLTLVLFAEIILVFAEKHRRIKPKKKESNK